MLIKINEMNITSFEKFNMTKKHREMKYTYKSKHTNKQQVYSTLLMSAFENFELPP